MALPTLTKTWQFNVNNAQGSLGSAASDNKTLLLNIKNALVGFGTLPWTVVYSCNSVTAGTAGDGVDRWSTIANIVLASTGSVHSWMVLKQTGIGSNFQILIDLNVAAGSSNAMTLAYSPSSGFTGGTTTTGPTAADQVAVITGAVWVNNVADVAFRWSVMQSSDGQCTRIFAYVAGTLRAFGAFEKGSNATGGTPGATNSGFVSWVGTGAPNFATTSATVQNGVTTATAASFELSALLSIASEVDGAWDILPVGIAGSSVGARGRLFTLQDIWVASLSLPIGDSFPSSGTTGQFVVAANNASWCIVLPWNTGAINTA